VSADRPNHDNQLQEHGSSQNGSGSNNSHGSSHLIDHGFGVLSLILRTGRTRSSAEANESRRLAFDDRPEPGIYHYLGGKSKQRIPSQTGISHTFDSWGCTLKSMLATGRSSAL